MSAAAVTLPPLPPLAPLPPLVEPAADLTPQEGRRYSRHLLLPAIGELGQRRLKAARVLVVGAGGLGSPALLYLAAAGVGTIGVVDDDVVEESNLQRQVLHATADVGRRKVDSAAAAVARANPLVQVVRHAERLTARNASALVAGYDLVLDGSDNFTTRYLVNDACSLAGIPWVWGAVLRFEGHVSTFWAGRGPTYRDLFPTAPDAGTVPSCGEAGVLGAVCAMVGSVMVAEAVKLLTGSGRTLLGRVVVVDSLAGTWRTLGLQADPTRAAVPEVAGAAEVPEVTSPVGGAPGDRGDVPTITAMGLADRLLARGADGTDLLLVDVREPAEHAAQAIPGSVLVPLDDVLAGALDGEPADRPLVLHCAAGGRSAQALLALLERGRTGVTHLAGGIGAWTAAGLAAPPGTAAAAGAARAGAVRL